MLIGSAPADGSVLTRQLDGFLSRERSLDTAGAIALGVLLCAELYGAVSTGPLLAWFGGVVATGLAIYAIGLCYRRRARLDRPRCCGIALAGLAVAQALAWGAVLLFLPASDVGIDGAVAAYTLSAIGLLGALSYAAFPPASIGFVLGLAVAVGGWFAACEDSHLSLALLGVALPAGASVWAASRSARWMRRRLRLRESRHTLAARLRAALGLSEAALNWVDNGVVAVDRHGHVRQLNAAAEGLTGWSAKAADGQPFTAVLTLLDDAARTMLPDPVARCLTSGKSVRLAGEVLLRDRGGKRETAVEVAVHPQPAGGAVAVLRDVTELRGMARSMFYQANHDALTGLLNQRGFEIRLARAVEGVRREGAPCVLVYLDLDRFRLVNDTCGHTAGDELLKNVSERIVRGAGGHAVVARLGGDEFGLLFEGATVEDARNRAEEIGVLVREHRFAWDDKVFNISCSMGLAPVDPDSIPADLFAAADAACYVAKEQGRNRVQVVQAHDRDLVRHQNEMAWTSRIRHALEQGRVRLRFQRIVPLRDDLPTMAELLLTLVDESGNPVAPTTFLPAAERFGLMNAVDREVVRRVFEHVARADDNPRLRDIEIFSLNVSGQSLSSSLFLDYCLQALTATGVDPRRICFEITETAVIANIERARIFIEALREHGCRFALDDFGSGASSFGYLRSLPVDFLKIDGQFVRHMAHDAIDRSMVASINEVGHLMGVRTVAEFVESQEVCGELERIGMDYVQGFRVHRPEYLD